jgi:uncharacterized membrane protein YfcA
VSFLIGLLAGIFGGLVGVGGGVIMIPLMVRVLKLDQHQAHGTSLVALVFTGIGGAIAYGLKGTVDIPASILLASTGILTARAGAHFAHSLPEWRLKRYFGGFLVYVSLMLLAKPYLSFIQATRMGFGEIFVLLLTGLFAGFLAGLMGIGSGSIMAPAMVLFLGFSQHTAQGTALLAMVPAGGVGAYAYWKLGNVRTDFIAGLIAGILIGSYLGGTFAHYLSEGVLRIVFAAVLIWTGARYLIAGRPASKS